MNMKIIELTEIQYNNYAKIHSKRNYFQSVAFTKLYEGLEVMYVGLVDDNNNLYAASSLIINSLKLNYKYAYAPRGFLIDYNNYELLTTFTNALKIFLKKTNIIFVKLDPYTEYKVYDKNNNILVDNTDLFNKMINLGYIHLGFNEGFEAFNPRYEVILKTNNIDEAYNNLSRNVKRSIKESSLMGITIHKGSLENLELFYDIIKKKTKKGISYYRNILNYFNNSNNNYEASLYFAKINSRTYMDNYRYLLDKEFKINTDVNYKIQSNEYKNTNKLVNKKIDSDRRLEIYNKHLVNSTNIYKNYPDGLVVGTCLIIKNDKEVYFLIDGYEEKLKDIYSSYLLKWEIIKKYINEGITKFNLGEITGNKNQENNKFYGLYFNKISFGGNIYEYPGEFDLVVNKTIYNLFYNAMHYSGKLKEK